MIFFVWILFSIAVGVLASNRGRSGIGWFLFSLLLSPLIGLIFCLVCKDLSNEKSDQQPNEKTHRKCPKCAEFIKPEASVCKHCGAEVIPDLDYVKRIESAEKVIESEKNSQSVKAWAGIVFLVIVLILLFKWLTKVELW